MILVDNMKSWLENFVDERLDSMKSGEALAKAESAQSDLLKAADQMQKQTLGRRGLLFDPLAETGLQSGLFRPKGHAGGSFVNNTILKIVTRRNPIASTIIHTRANQVATFCRLRNDRFDTGFQVKASRSDVQSDPAEVDAIEQFILNCGLTEGRDDADKLSFSQFGYMVAWDFMTYGHTAIENVRRQDGGLFAFLPLPAETIYHATKSTVGQKAVDGMIAATRGAIDSLLSQSGENPDHGPYAGAEAGDPIAYVQSINGKVVQGFSKDDLTFALLYSQSDADLQGYSISPLERAIGMVTAQLQIENHQRMFFTHGVASKGLLVLQGDVTPNQLRALQSQWTNQVTGPQGAWRTPILAGIKGAQWIPLTMGSRDMEYAAYQDHVLRVLHACFAIDPEETGFGYLSKGTEQRSLGESSNEWKVTASRDRGLRPILARLEAIVNELLTKWDPILADKYKFSFVGLEAETRGEEIERLKEEVQLHTTLNEAREQAEMEGMQIGGGLILNPLLVQVLQNNLPKGVFMETFLGVAGASARPDLQYIPDPLWFQWQQMQLQMMQMQAGVNPDGEEGEEEDEEGQEGGEDGDEEKKGPPKKKSKKKDKDGGEEDQSGDDENEQDPEAQAQAQAAQADAVNKFIQANPSLFKSLQENLKKSDLAKSELQKLRVNDKHVEKLADDLCDDYSHAGDMLVREIMAAVADEMKSDAGKK
jgi:hypothetical protein